MTEPVLCDPEWASLPAQRALEKAFSLRDSQFIHLIEGDRVTANYARRPALSAVLGVRVENGVVVETREREPLGQHNVVVLHHAEFGDLDIDEKIADIIKALWDRHIDTTSCCQSAWMDEMDQLPGGVFISVRIGSFPAFTKLLTDAMGSDARRWFATFANVAKPDTPNEVLVHTKIPLRLVEKLRARLGLESAQ